MNENSNMEVIGIMTKAVALLSGGLDSTLAVKLMIDQGIEVYALNFTSAFCTCDSGAKKKPAKDVAEKAAAHIEGEPQGVRGRQGSSVKSSACLSRLSIRERSISIS